MFNNYEKDSMQDICDAQNGNKEKMAKLIDDNKGLIWSIVRRFKDRGYELEDLYQVGTMGFIKCIKRFDTNFDVKISTYAVPYILGEIKRYIRDDGPIKVSRSIKELGSKILDVKNEHLKKTGQEIKVEEISKILKISKEEVALALDAFKPVESIYENTYEDEDGGVSKLDRISSNIDEATIITNKICIRDIISKLKEEEKQVILLRYYKGKTQSEVAKIMGITQVQVSRMEKKTLNSMRLKLAI